MPTDPVDRDKDRPIVESWIADDLKKRGQTRFTAVTGWVPLGPSFLESTDIWDGVLGQQSYCRVGADIEREKGSMIRVNLSGWHPGGAHVTVPMKDETGGRTIAGVTKFKSEQGMPYVAVFVGPPPQKIVKTAAPTDR